MVPDKRCCTFSDTNVGQTPVYFLLQCWSQRKTGAVGDKEHVPRSLEHVPCPQQRWLPLQQAFQTPVFDLKLAMECGKIIMLVRAVMVSADTLCRCCGLGVLFFYLHAPFGFTPFPVQGFTPLNSLTAECTGCCSSCRVQAQHRGLSL